MRTTYTLAVAALVFVAEGRLLPPKSWRPLPTPSISPRHDRRQNNADSVCSVYGIDIQGGGSYFVNTASNDDFTVVSQFEGCTSRFRNATLPNGSLSLTMCSGNNDTAHILLVNDQTTDEYECTSLIPVPDDVSLMSTCPIKKSQMSSGSWSILTLGNNGDGEPFSYKRDFTLDVGPQQTTTVTVSAPYTLTLQETSTIQCAFTWSWHSEAKLTAEQQRPRRTSHPAYLPTPLSLPLLQELPHTRRQPSPSPPPS